ncbi:hypothetical protein BGAL_0056g00120 [Botrytis galanthina]|uniref:Uncharacterized protein n=1 Tax=Botrytis galanthina TaxID=278940 RepID=A0A4S8RA05_9HELO|nr:hypothetical protein BGAL_0056g00120 [Botrytis galanthina]
MTLLCRELVFVPKFGARSAQLIVFFTDPFERILVEFCTNEINLVKFFLRFSPVVTQSSRKVASVKIDEVNTEDIGVDKINDEEMDVVKTNASDFGVNVVNACDLDGNVFVTE